MEISPILHRQGLQKSGASLFRWLKIAPPGVTLCTAKGYTLENENDVFERKTAICAKKYVEIPRRGFAKGM